MLISMLVVLYNCKPEESETIKSLIKSSAAFSNARLCIWNNGPIEALPNRELVARLKEKGISTSYIETLNNVPLSWIYNTFMEKHVSRKYVILDHDSTLSEDYISHIASEEISYLEVPIIEAKGSPHSPTVNGKFSPGPFSKDECVVAIGSGIIISQEALETIKSAYGNVFDDCFSLYGVDTSFFVRVFKLGLSGRVKTLPGFSHSLSRLEDETEEIKRFRRIERSYDLGLMLRHYPKVIYLKLLAKQVALAVLGKNQLDLRKMLSAFARGLHTKCSVESKKKFHHSLVKQVFHE